MRFMIFFFICCHLLPGTADWLVPGSDFLTGPADVLALEKAETPGAYDTGTPKNYFAGTGIFILGLVIIWFVFYKLVYPFLLRYYSPFYCKTLFWSMFLLYSMAWISVSVYRIFEIGFFYGWAKWIFAFMGAIWLIWFLVVMLRKDSSYTY